MGLGIEGERETQREIEDAPERRGGILQSGRDWYRGFPLFPGVTVPIIRLHVTVMRTFLRPVP